MAYYPSYPYTYPFSFSLDCNVEAGPSVQSHIWGDSYAQEFFPSGAPIHPDPWEIPPNTYSTLAGAVTPENPISQASKAQPLHPTPLRVQHQSVHPVPPQQTWPALPRSIHPACTQFQPAQPANPLLAAPSRSGVRTRPSTSGLPPATDNRRRAAYVRTDAPRRHRKPPAGTATFCRVHGCKYWTKDLGKKLARHRTYHFPGRAGVACLHCGCIFSRSDQCGRHLERCNPQLWKEIATTKGTQDPWGMKVGQDLIDKSLVDGIYIPQEQYKL